MERKISGGWLCGTFVALSVVAIGQAQTSAPAGETSQAVRPLGVVMAIDATRKQITLKTDAGPQLTIIFEDATAFLRVLPGEKGLKNATKIAFGDVAVGDRVLARGRLADDQKSIAAASVIVMSKVDIAKKQEADRAEWRRRGVGGVIKAINAEAKEVTITTPSREGTKSLAIELRNSVLRRYAPDSVKFSDAKPSTFAELKLGDQVRALGNKSQDGARFSAEQLVSGSFRNIAGTVISVDPGEKTIKIRDLAAKKPLLVRINADSNLRKLPPFVAQMLALRMAGGGPGGAPGGGGPGRGPEGGPDLRSGRGEGPAQDRPQRGLAGRGAPAAGGPGGSAGMPGRQGAPDMQQMLDRMPAVTLDDLKPGDAIMVASTVGADPGEVTAITLLAGVEPLLTAAPGGGQQMTLGSWNLDLNMNMGMP